MIEHSSVTTSTPPLHIVGAMKAHNPLIICITNDVVKPFTANGLLAIGASPIMSECMEDLKNFIVHASSLLINMGTITPLKLAYYKEAITLAHTHKVPIIVDPVGCHAGQYRLHATLELLATGNISVLRGNQSEIMALYQAISKDRSLLMTETPLRDHKTALREDKNAKDILASTVNSESSLCDRELDSNVDADIRGKGVDGGTIQHMGATILSLSRLLKIPIIATGEVDYVSDGTRVFTVDHGHPLMTRVTGTGCLLGAVIAAFVGIYDECDSELSYGEYLAYVLAYYGLAGERAVTHETIGPGSFSIQFMDALYEIDDEIVSNLSRIKQL